MEGVRDAGTKRGAGGHIWKLAGRVTVSRQRHERSYTFSRWAVKSPTNRVTDVTNTAKPK